jgi:hypothetical protein
MDLQQPNIDQITAEIRQLKVEMARNMIKYGKAALGENATLKKIANYVGPQFGLSSGDCMKIFALTVLKTGGEVLE